MNVKLKDGRVLPIEKGSYIALDNNGDTVEVRIEDIESFEDPLKSNFKSFDKVVCRNSKLEWFVDIFSHMRGSDFQCIGGLWDECLPYNEHTCHLVGTQINWDYNDVSGK
jgi:hypothetical protein